jgi:hypothetical protein
MVSSFCTTHNPGLLLPFVYKKMEKSEARYTRRGIVGQVKHERELCYKILHMYYICDQLIQWM